ncbi:MAG: hypothetical protein LBT47_07270, partial [Deltaproteobacteria bacterium]|nr:hypothetical protein [Deltaproteobacteria bacterium]
NLSPINVDTSTSNRGALCAKVCPQGSVRGDARKGVPYRDIEEILTNTGQHTAQLGFPCKILTCHSLARRLT